MAETVGCEVSQILHRETGEMGSNGNLIKKEIRSVHQSLEVPANKQHACLYSCT